jgi:capsule biosynthesis phosphatase
MKTPLHLFILCGGNGKRMNEYSFPKPLNMINGKPLIYYTLSKLPHEIKELNFIVGSHLLEYNFNEIVINLFPKIKCNFYHLPYFTRGAIESAYLGVKDLNMDGSIVFLDNDNLYSFPEDFYKSYNDAFIGYYDDSSKSENYSFITMNDNDVITGIKEKVRISNFAVAGIYGFKSLQQFKEIACTTLNKDCNLKEFYMSILYEGLLRNGSKINALKFPSFRHIGTYDDMINELLVKNEILKLPKMRICFDLDNTIVTYPSIPGDYSTVKPIEKIITFMRKLKAEGNTIIIYTARRMKTHNHNAGAVLADIGEITFRTLREFDVPYDEIIFGKPIADIYIDDKSINPYKNDMRLFGIMDFNSHKNPLNKLDNNKYNTIELVNNQIKKSGRSEYLEGEIYFYKKISQISDCEIRNYFPTFYKHDGNTTLYMENIVGIPFYLLYKNEMITSKHLKDLFSIINKLHSYKYDSGTDISDTDIINNYSEKLKNRFMNKNDYPFEDAEEVQELVLKRLEDYYKSCNFEISDIIHGDLWFSNIIIDYSNNIKLIDMKGKVYDKYTTKGHIYYDYGKLYQSFLGFDEILYGDSINNSYKRYMESLFENYATSIGINMDHLETITFSLVIGTLHSINNEDKKRKVWQWIKETFI